MQAGVCNKSPPPRHLRLATVQTRPIRAITRGTRHRWPGIDLAASLSSRAARGLGRPRPREGRSGESQVSAVLRSALLRSRGRAAYDNPALFQPRRSCAARTSGIPGMLAAAVKLTVVADENLTVGSSFWLPAESLAPGR